MVTVATFSEAGGHLHNEDAFVVRQHPLDPDLWLCFVADGQGGQTGGGPAARLACETALDATTAYPPERLSDPATWPGILRAADEAVSSDPASGFTTLVGLCVSRSRVIGASSGDSAVMLVDGQKAVELTSGQFKNPPVGSGGAVAVPFTAPLGERWQILAMSDGVWKYVGWNRVIEAARQERGDSLIAELQRRARLPGSGGFQDDFTVVVLENVEEQGANANRPL